MERQGVESGELMLRAAKGLTDKLCALLGDVQGKTCTFACGSGGNGGDGYAAARMFAEKGGRAIVLDALPDLPRRPDAEQMRLWALEHPNVWHGTDFSTMPRPAAWVDAVFGIGLNRSPSDELTRLFNRMESDRQHGSIVVSCDIPSGLQADTGETPGICVHADYTVTFAHAKPGHYLGNGMDLCGSVLVHSIGIPLEYLPQDAIHLVEPVDLIRACQRRLHNSHKGMYGHLLLVAGSLGMAGAAALCANAALRSGVGLLTIACPQSIVPILQILAPCAMCLPLPEENGAICAKAVPALREALLGKDAIAIGPGLSRKCPADVVQTVLESDLPCLLDADALNIISENKDLLRLLHKDCVITPHPGEAARLVRTDLHNPLASLHALQSLGCTVLLKGAATLISGAEGTYMSVSGSPGMARGGSGDVLTGIAGALLARGFDTLAAAWMASEAHGLAGELAADRVGEIGMTAQDLISTLPEVWENAR